MIDNKTDDVTVVIQREAQIVAATRKPFGHNLLHARAWHGWGRFLFPWPLTSCGIAPQPDTTPPQVTAAVARFPLGMAFVYVPVTITDDRELAIETVGASDFTFSNQQAAVLEVVSAQYNRIATGVVFLLKIRAPEATGVYQVNIAGDIADRAGNLAAKGVVYRRFPEAAAVVFEPDTAISATATALLLVRRNDGRLYGSLTLTLNEAAAPPSDAAFVLESIRTGETITLSNTGQMQAGNAVHISLAVSDLTDGQTGNYFLKMTGDSGGDRLHTTKPVNLVLHPLKTGFDVVPGDSDPHSGKLIYRSWTGPVTTETQNFAGLRLGIVARVSGDTEKRQFAVVMIEAEELNQLTGKTINEPIGDDRAVWQLLIADLDQDGRGDLIRTDYLYQRNTGEEQVDNAGKVDIVFGNGHSFALYGRGQDHGLGIATALAGDVNQDGTPDLFVGGFKSAYVLYGGTALWQMSGTDPATLSPEFGFAVRTPPPLKDDFLLHGNFPEPQPSVSFFKPVGDISGDGLIDLAYLSADPRNTHLSVLFGRKNPEADLANDLTSPDFMLKAGLGQTGGPRFEYLAAPVDFNADGIDDLVFSVQRGGHSGKMFILFGGTNLSRFTGNNIGVERVFWSDPVPATGMRLDFAQFMTEETANVTLIRGIGDVNGDHADDLAIVCSYLPGGKKFYLVVLYGGAHWQATNSFITVTDIDAADNPVFRRPDWQGVMLTHDAGFDFKRLHPAGDLNGDGYDDFFAGDTTKHGFVFYGSAYGLNYLDGAAGDTAGDNIVEIESLIF